MGFNEEIDLIQRQLDTGTDKIVKDVSIAVLSAVALGTPVGNPTLWQNPESAPPGYAGGRARGNWQLAIGSAPSAEVSNKDKSGVGVINSGKSTVSRYRLGPKVFIVNNVPYIVRLNNGHSTQAPVGFIQKAIQAATQSVRSNPGPLP